MDQVKRAASRLRRLQRASAWNAVSSGTSAGRSYQSYFEEPYSLRSLVNGPDGLQLRKTIDDFVVAFVPPSLPLTESGLTCTDALVEIDKGGHWTFNLRVEALSQAPVAFVAGFVTNQHGYFAGMFGALNYAGGPANTSSASSAGTFSIYGFSKWIEGNYAAAAAEGVTIRIHSSTDLQASPRSFVQGWAASFGRGLFRPLSILDTDDNYYTAWGVPYMEGGTLLDQAGQDQGLSFEVSLRFE